MKPVAYAAMCPHCTYAADMASSVSGEEMTPVVGDLSMCIACGQYSFFDGAQRLRKPTPDEQRKIDADPRYQKIVETWRRTKRDAMQEGRGWPKPRPEGQG